MLNQHTKSYIEDYISNNILKLVSPGEPIRDDFNRYFLHSNTLNGLTSFIEKWIDADTKKRMFASVRKHLSRRNVAIAHNGQRETNIKLAPKTKETLNSLSAILGESMTDTLALLVAHAKSMSPDELQKIRKAFKNK